MTFDCVRYTTTTTKILCQYPSANRYSVYWQSILVVAVTFTNNLEKV